MARLQYADTERAEVASLVQRIVSERGSVLHLYQMLLHSPPIAEGWLAFLTAVRQRCDLAGSLRELVIMRVAILNGAEYEAEQHAPIALKEGLTTVQLAELKSWEGSNAFSLLERAVLQLTDSMTCRVQISETEFDAVRQHFSPRHVVELVATIAAYNMVSRFLEALAIHSDDGRPR